MKRINSYKATAALVRGFFEAYTRGIIDAKLGGNAPFEKKNAPAEIKQAMLDHYGEVNHHFFEIMVPVLVRLNYASAEEANERMQKCFAAQKASDPTFEPSMIDYLQQANKSPQLYRAMEQEYKRNFSLLLMGHFSSAEQHFSDYTRGVLLSQADEPLAIHLLVRTIVKAYAAGITSARQQTSAQASINAQSSTPLHMPTLHGMLLSNVNLLLGEAPLTSDTSDPVALFREACQGREENLNTLFNTLNDTMQELAEQ